MRRNTDQELMKREEKKKEIEEETMLNIAAKEAEEQETSRYRKEQRLERVDKQREKLVELIRRKARIAQSRREEVNQRNVEKERRMGRAEHWKTCTGCNV